MKFTYEKTKNNLVAGDVEPETIHRIKLDDSDFQIIASRQGFKFYGESQWFQPEAGEIHLAVEDFKEFMHRLASAADLAWKEQQLARKNILGRQAILGAVK